MNPVNFIKTSNDLYKTSIWRVFGDFQYRFVIACRKHEPQIKSLGDLLKMSPSDIKNVKGVGPVTWNAFIEFLVKHTHLVCIPDFPYNPELQNLVLSKVDTPPTPITEELKFFSASVRCPWGFSVCIVKAVSEYDAKIKVQEKFGDRNGSMIYRIILNEIDIKNNDVIEVFNK